MAALLTLAILDSVILVFSLKLIHICQDWFPLFAWKKFTHSFWPNLMMAAILNSVILKSTILDSANLHKKNPDSFILIELDDGSYLEFSTLDSAILHKINFTHSFWLNLMMAAIFNFAILKFGLLASGHLSFSSQTHSHLPRLVPTICTKKLHSFFLIQLDDGSHFEFCHVGFRHCHLGFRDLVIFSQIHSNTLLFHSDSDSN